KATLAGTLAELEKAMDSFDRGSEYASLIVGDSVWIPEVLLDIEHRFQELEGRERRFRNAKLRDHFLDTAAQTIRFKLDANGAELASTGRVGAIKRRPTQQYHFDRPFLLCVKRRGQKQPFLVMWIDNSGLMRPVEPVIPDKED